MAVLLTAQFYSPAQIFMIDLDDKRLAVAKTFGATALVNSAKGDAAEQIMKLTEGAGVDVAIEAVGLPATFAICQAIVAAAGRIANVGVHGKPVELHLEKVVGQKYCADDAASGYGDDAHATESCAVREAGAEKTCYPSLRVGVRFLKAYDTFEHAAKEGALKVVADESGYAARRRKNFPGTPISLIGVLSKTQKTPGRNL